MSIDPYDHVICIKCYYRDLLVKMLKFAFLGVYGYTPYQWRKGRGECQDFLVYHSILASPSSVLYNDSSDENDGESGMGRSIECLNGCKRGVKMGHSPSLVGDGAIVKQLIGCSARIGP